MPTLILKLRGREIKRTPITRTHTFIGRDPTCDLVIDNPAISRRHARVEFQNDHFLIFDNSSNGIFLDDAPVRWHRLRDGDHLHIGKFELAFSVHGGAPLDRLELVDAERTAVGEVEDTTHLPASYAQKLRQVIEAEDQAEQLAEAYAKQASRLRVMNVLLFLIVVALAGALYWLWTQTGGKVEFP